MVMAPVAASIAPSAAHPATCPAAWSTASAGAPSAPCHGASFKKDTITPYLASHCDTPCPPVWPASYCAWPTPPVPMRSAYGAHAACLATPPARTAVGRRLHTWLEGTGAETWPRAVRGGPLHQPNGTTDEHLGRGLRTRRGTAGAWGRGVRTRRGGVGGRGAHSRSASARTSASDPPPPHHNPEVHLTSFYFVCYSLVVPKMHSLVINIPRQLLYGQQTRQLSRVWKSLGPGSSYPSKMQYATLFQQRPQALLAMIYFPFMIKTILYVQLATFCSHKKPTHGILQQKTLQIPLTLRPKTWLHQTQLEDPNRPNHRNPKNRADSRTVFFCTFCHLS